MPTHTWPSFFISSKFTKRWLLLSKTPSLFDKYWSTMKLVGRSFLSQPAYQFVFTSQQNERFQRYLLVTLLTKWRNIKPLICYEQPIIPIIWLVDIVLRCWWNNKISRYGLFLLIVSILEPVLHKSNKQDIYSSFHYHYWKR